jgi:alkylation response protein AidB-like acyl-CoA dehydrogenase
MDMMDFQISEKMQVILEMMNEFVDKELIPLEPEFLNREFVDLLPVLQEKRQMVRKMELWAPNHPKELGGMGLDLVEHGLVSEVLGRTQSVIMYSTARRPMQAISKFSINTAPHHKKSNTWGPSWTGGSAAAFP